MEVQKPEGLSVLSCLLFVSVSLRVLGLGPLGWESNWTQLSQLQCFNQFPNFLTDARCLQSYVMSVVGPAMRLLERTGAVGRARCVLS